MQEQGYPHRGRGVDRPRQSRRAPRRPRRAPAAISPTGSWTTGPAFLTRDTTEDVVIRTTFDPRSSARPRRRCTDVFETKVAPGSKAQAAIVVMSADGAVRAMVGGRKFRGVAGQFNRAIQAKRQTGSAFKPFVYAAALEIGLPPDDGRGRPVTINVPGSGAWTPEELLRRLSTARVTLTEALSGRSTSRR